MNEIVPGDLRLEEDVPLLEQAQTALLVGGVVAVPPCLDGPGDSVGDARPLQAPYMLAEGGTLGILVLHVEGVAPVPVFEGRLAEPSVGLLGDDGQGRGGLLLGGRHLCLVYYAWGQAVPLLIRVKKRAGRRAGEAVTVFPHDHLRMPLWCSC